METVGSLPHSQMPATCPSPDLYQSTPFPHTPLLEDPPWYYPPIYACVFLVVFSSGFHTKPFYTLLLSPIRATCPVHPIFLDFITRIISEQYRSLSSSLCNFPHSHVTSSLLVAPDILLNTLFSKTLNLRSSLSVSDQVSHPYKNRKNYSSEFTGWNMAFWKHVT